MFDWACQPFFTLVTTFVFAPYFAAAWRPTRWQARACGATPRRGRVSCSRSCRRSSAPSPTPPGRRSHGSPPAAPCSSSRPGSSGSRRPARRMGSPMALVGLRGRDGGGRGGGGVQQRHDGAPRPAGAARAACPAPAGRSAIWAGSVAGDRARLPGGYPGHRTDLSRPEAALRARSGHAGGDRITGPLSAAWFLVFVLPLFLFTPDVPSTERPAARGRHAQGWPASTHGGTRRDPSPASSSPTWSIRTGSWRSSPSAASTGPACSAGAGRTRRVRHPPTVTGPSAPSGRPSRRSLRAEARDPRRARRSSAWSASASCRWAATTSSS